MPPLSELPGHVSRKKLLQALQRIGFVINMSGGKGSHVLAMWPSTQKSTTIPFEDIPKQVLFYLLKEIEKNSAGVVTWNRIHDEL